MKVIKPKRATGRVAQRAAAAIRYITHPKGITLAQLQQFAEFNDVTVDTLRRWCREDDWDGQRESYITEWSTAATRLMGEETAQARLNEMRLLDELIERGLNLLRDGLISPKSWEGVSRVVKDAIMAKDGLRTQTTKEVMEQSQPGRGGPETSGFSDAEADLMARELLRLRRDQGRLLGGKVAEAILSDRDQPCSNETNDATDDSTTDSTVSVDFVCDDPSSSAGGSGLYADEGSGADSGGVRDDSARVEGERPEAGSDAAEVGTDSQVGDADIDGDS